MKIRVFYPNHNGKIEFTRQELEKLLNEVYHEGQMDCNCRKSWTWATPYCNDNNLSLSTTALSNSATSATNIIDNSKAESINNVKPIVTAIEINEDDISKVAETVKTMLNQNGALTARRIDDVYSTLAKELNF